MSQTITITNEDILEQVKLSCKIPEIVDQIIIRKIIEKAVLEAGLQVEDEELQEAADQMRLINKLMTVEDTRKWLEKYSLSLDDFEAVVYNRILNTKLATHLFSDQIEPYFYDNQLDYTGVVMYEIILDDEDLAMELFFAIKEGEMGFYEAAHKYIQDQELRRKCGYRGIVHRKDLKAEISAAVFAAKASELIKPIVTSKGVHLILIEEFIQPQLNDKLRYQIISDLFDSWVKASNNTLKPIIQPV